MTADTTTKLKVTSKSPPSHPTITTPKAISSPWLLRVVFVFSLVLAAAICGIVTYLVVDGLEQDVGFQTYESVANSALSGAQAITIRKIQGGEAMASVLSYAFPDAWQWPLAVLNGYPKTAARLAKLSSSTSQGLIALVKPDEVQEFERVATQTYAEQGYAHGAGESDFGFGIWKKDTSNQKEYDDGRLPDTTGEIDYDGPYKNLLAPIFLHNIIDARSLMFNVHSNEL